MDRNLKHTLIWIAVACIAIAYWISLYGCAHYDRTGHHVATITVQIHVVGENGQYDWERAKRFNSGIGAYAKNTNPPEIWLTGYRDKQGIWFDRVDFLGHEILEVLRFANPEFANPHE